MLDSLTEYARGPRRSEGSVPVIQEGFLSGTRQMKDLWLVLQVEGRTLQKKGWGRGTE